MKNNSSGFYYGWVIAVTSGVILLINNGMTLAGLNVYDRPLLDALAEAGGEAVPLAQLKVRDTITLLVSGLMAPLAGAVADRLGVRPLMMLGALLLAGAYFLYSMVDSLGQIYGIHVLFASALATSGLVVNVILVSRWFVKHRGLALGIALAGTSLGNGTLPPLNVALMAEVGWRQAMALNSLLPLLLLPIIFFVVRERPSDMGLTPPADPGKAGMGDPDTGMTLRNALRTRNFWILAMIASCTFFSIIGTQAHLNLYVLSRDMSQMDAGLSYTMLFYLGLFGKLASGFLADRLGRKRVFIGTLSLMLVGAHLMTGNTALWGALFFGLGWGGLYTLLQPWRRITGPRNLGKIIGMITVIDTLGGASARR